MASKEIRKWVEHHKSKFGDSPSHRNGCEGHRGRSPWADHGPYRTKRRVEEEEPLSSLFHGLQRRQQDQLGDQQDREQLDDPSLWQNASLDPQSRRKAAVRSSRMERTSPAKVSAPSAMSTSAVVEAREGSLKNYLDN